MASFTLPWGLMSGLCLKSRECAVALLHIGGFWQIWDSPLVEISMGGLGLMKATQASASDTPS